MTIGYIFMVIDCVFQLKSLVLTLKLCTYTIRHWLENFQHNGICSNDICMEKDFNLQM